MNLPDLYQRAKLVFLEVVDLPKSERESIVRRLCGGDESLRIEVENLLKFDREDSIIDGHTTTLRQQHPHHTSHDSKAHHANWRRPFNDCIQAFSRPSLQSHLRWWSALGVIWLLGELLLMFAHATYSQSMKSLLQSHVQQHAKVLDLWIRDRKAELDRASAIPEISESIQSLIALASQDKRQQDSNMDRTSLDSELHRGLSATFPIFQNSLPQGSSSTLHRNDHGQDFGYSFWDRSGNVIASSMKGPLGNKALSSDDFITTIAPAFEGKRFFSSPQDGLNWYSESSSMTEDQDVWMLGPVYGSDGKVIAAMGLSYRVNATLGQITQSEPGAIWDTILFDEHGHLVGGSNRWGELLLMDPESTESKVDKRLPMESHGENLDGHTKELQPFKELARSGISQERSSNIHGYNDFRGKKMIGAWRWLPSHGIGVATEMDHATAFRWHSILRWLWNAIGTALLVSLLLLFYRRPISKEGSQDQVLSHVDSYRIINKLSEGGMGIIYLCVQERLRRFCAVKVLKRHFTLEHKRRFEREVLLASSLDHPNTIQILDFGTNDDGQLYYTMEYIDGWTLSQLSEEGPVPAARVIHFLSQICGSIHEAHERGLVHRDIKPHNIMFCERGGVYDYVKVLDFGLVKDLLNSHEDLVTATLMWMGTLRYLPPERLGRTDATDRRSDIYQIGYVAYRLLTGTDPFEATSDVEMIAKIAQEHPIPPTSKSRLPVPLELSELVMRCLEKQPSRRPQSCTEILNALSQMAIANTWTQTQAEKWWKSRSTPKPTCDPTLFT